VADNANEIRYVILESGNDLDITQAELDDVVARVEARLRESHITGIEVVAIAQTAKGVGNQWADVLHVFIPARNALPEVIWVIILDQVKDLMRARFRKRHESRRPRVIVIRDSEAGEVRGVLRRTAADEDFIQIETNAADPREPPPLRLLPPEG
jgi:hypothetical protein